jgi:hypothetical protein
MRRNPFPARAAALALSLGVALALAAPAASTPLAAVAARAASLSVTPANGEFTAGQQLTFTGNLGRSGKRVQLQSNMGRPGDVWRDVPGATGRTNASGNFTIRTQAPSMYGIHYRAVAGTRTTPTWTSQVRHQEVSVTAETDRTDLGWGQGLVGYPLTVTASTAAMPLIPGRSLSLQQRVGTGWTTVATGTLGPEGTGTFAVTPATPGTLVYRVRLEDWNSGVGHVGWFPSYPVYVEVLASPPAEPARPAAPRYRPTVPAMADARMAPVQTTAAATNKWGIQRFDFDWEHGESLTDKASIGTRRRGWWLDAADGSGRVAMRNGAMQMSSAPEGGTSRGSLWATLQRNTQPYGRWETRVMPMTAGRGSVDYRVRAELVPADAGQRCGGPGITLFDVTPSQSQVIIGATSPSGAQWTRTVPGVAIDNAFHAFAVEVTPKKITWFIDGKAVGRVTDRAAISGQPMTVRMTMQASGAETMRTTRTLVDWVRAYPADTGRKTKGGVRLGRGTYAPTC